MKSRASFKAHPIHPALIPFPFAFLAGAAVFDLLALALEAEALSVTAAHLTLAGVATGLLAAVPGIIDYIYTVPPESSARTRATRHGLGNVAVLLLFIVAFTTRDAQWVGSLTTVAIQLAATFLLAYAASLGGTLVTRNMISVDHRYAEAGKWQEQTLSGRAGTEIVVGRADELEEGQMKLLHVNGRRIVLGRTDGGVVAAEDRCSHRGGSLAGGVLIGSTVQCLWHGSQFDLASGAVVCGPARTPITTFKTREEGGRIFLTIPTA